MNAQHKRCKEEVVTEQSDKNIPRISMVYFYISKKDKETEEHSVIAMVHEKTGERYARATGRKGPGQCGELIWLFQDMVEELKSWGHTVGNNWHILMKVLADT